MRGCQRELTPHPQSGVQRWGHGACHAWSSQLPQLTSQPPDCTVPLLCLVRRLIQHYLHIYVPATITKLSCCRLSSQSSCSCRQLNARRVPRVLLCSIPGASNQSPFTTMVELRKRKTPPPAPAPVAKKERKSKAKKATDEATDASVPAPEPTAVPAAEEAPTTAADAEPTSSGPPKAGDSITLDGFGGDIETNDGEKTSLKALVEKSEAGVVLFTYPKASTPGCRSSIHFICI